jgi:Tol biopolymer transport system component|tara:strand:- start:8189 stop:8431 length:243 start_codon:yes stop_codon:yes gene_type:complete
MKFSKPLMFPCLIFMLWTIGCGGTQQSVTASAATPTPTLTPDGARIAFHSTRDGNHEIYVMNIDGSSQTNLTPINVTAML